MKKIKCLLPFICIILLLNSCSAFIRLYRSPNIVDVNYEGSAKGPILTFIHFGYDEPYIFPFSYIQFIFPPPNEKYIVDFSLTNINDALKNVAEREKKEYTDDIMRSMYFDEFRIVLPSGKIIDLLEGKIDITYHYNGSEKETGMLYKEVKNFKPQYIDGVKRLFFDGIKDGDGISVYFYAKIPAYFVNSVRLEYTQTIEWENMGTVKRRTVMIFNKKLEKWYAFTV